MSEIKTLRFVQGKSGEIMRITAKGNEILLKKAWKIPKEKIGKKKRKRKEEKQNREVVEYLNGNGKQRCLKNEHNKKK